jgi:hypothetical protein
VIETEWAYYVFRLDSLAPAGVPPLARVRDEVQRLAAAAKRLAALRATADEVATEVRGGASLESAAGRRGLTVRTLGPFTRYTPPPAFQGAPAAVGASFGLGVGQTGGPVHSPNGAFFLRPLRKVLADSSAFAAQRASLRAAAVQQARQERVQLVLASLREGATVDDRRLELQRQQRQAAQQALPVGF